MKKTASILLLNILCVTGVVTLDADTIYISRTTYESAHPNKYVIDFSNYGPSGTLYISGLTASTPFGNVSFQGSPQPRLEILDANFFGFAGSGNLVLFALDADFNQDSLLITLPANSFSFGTDMISPSATVPELYQFTLFSGSTVLNTLESPSITGNYTFIGYDSASDPITSIAVQIKGTSGNAGPVLDNFTVVPEPSAPWLIGLAAASSLLVSLRRFRASGRSVGR